MESSQGHGARAEIVLFGVRVEVDPMRKCVSLNDLSRYELPPQVGQSHVSAAADYTSGDGTGTGSIERKRGVSWTEDEHKLFLLGLQKIGKGDWRGISRNFVKSRTPTQVASHAQKYFLRLDSNASKQRRRRSRRRSSVFDMTAESVAAANASLQSPKETPAVIASEMSSIHSNNNETPSGFNVQPNPLTSRTPDLNSMTTNHPLSLDLSLSTAQNHLPRYSPSIQMQANLNNDESIITVA